MELKEFIKSSVKAFTESILELREELGPDGIIIEPTSGITDKRDRVYENEEGEFTRIKIINYDVAVTVTNSKSGGIGGNISVLSFGGVKAEGEVSSENTNVTRMKFSIDIVPPVIK